MKHLEQAFAQKNWPQVQSLLSQALVNVRFNEIASAQSVYEMGAFAAVALKDQSAFDRYMSLLFPMYFDERKTNVKDAGTSVNVLLGLYLLSLLVRNHVADFHVTLERINIATALDINNVYIQFAVQLQQCLIEGTYHRVVLARQQVPSPEYAWFIDGLMDTIRNELAACIEKSFQTIDMASAAKLLLLTPEQIPQLSRFAEQVSFYHWPA